MKNGYASMKIVGVCIIRDSQENLERILSHLENKVTEVVLYDASDAGHLKGTYKDHPLVSYVIENRTREVSFDNREMLEGKKYHLLFDEARKLSPDWIYIFEENELIEFYPDIPLNDTRIETFSFRLFDNYLGKDFKNVDLISDKIIGPEYKEVPMLFRPSLPVVFESRVPSQLKNVKLGGSVRRFRNTLDNNLSIYNRALIRWDERDDLGFELSTEFESLYDKKLKILVATYSLDNVGGTETFSFTFIEELLNYKNFEVEYFTTVRGEIAKKIENEFGVSYLSKSAYDVIFFNHNEVLEVLKFNLKIRGIFIQTCHGIYPELEQPHYRADGYVSISQEIQNHLALRGYSSLLLLNMINLSRFKSDKVLNDVPKSLLSLCHSEEANSFLKEVSHELGIVYREAFKYKNAVWNIERVINQSDIVIGLGRSALEAVSCGRPVIIYDRRRYFDAYGDGYLADNLGLSLQNNCSGRYSKKVLSKQELITEIKKYDKGDAQKLRAFAIKKLDAKNNVLEYLKYYLVIREQKKEKKFLYQIKSELKTLARVGPIAFLRLVKKRLT